MRAVGIRERDTGGDILGEGFFLEGKALGSKDGSCHGDRVALREGRGKIQGTGRPLNEGIPKLR